jgi:hypothetical protein
VLYPAVNIVTALGQTFIFVDKPYHVSHFVNDCLTNDNFEQSQSALNLVSILNTRMDGTLHDPIEI